MSFTNSETEGQFSAMAENLVFNALALAVKRAKGHARGVDVVWCVIDIAKEQFGTMAEVVLKKHHLTTPQQIGLCVWGLLAKGDISATEDDNIEDFNLDIDVLKAVEYQWPCRTENRQAVRGM